MCFYCQLPAPPPSLPSSLQPPVSPPFLQFFTFASGSWYLLSHTLGAAGGPGLICHHGYEAKQHVQPSSRRVGAECESGGHRDKCSAFPCFPQHAEPPPSSDPPAGNTYLEQVKQKTGKKITVALRVLSRITLRRSVYEPIVMIPSPPPRRRRETRTVVVARQVRQWGARRHT